MHYCLSVPVTVLGLTSRDHKTLVTILEVIDLLAPLQASSPSSATPTGVKRSLAEARVASATVTMIDLESMLDDPVEVRLKVGTELQ